MGKTAPLLNDLEKIFTKVAKTIEKVDLIC
jgi:hypothetical protein